MVEAKKKSAAANLQTRLKDAESQLGRSIGLSAPSFDQVLELRSLQAQRAVANSFPKAARSLFLLDIILRAISTGKEVNQVIEGIEKDITDVTVALKAELNRVTTLCENTGVTQMPDYRDTWKMSVPVTTPQMRHLLAAVRTLDDIMARIDALWLMGEIATPVREAQGTTWQRRLSRMFFRIDSVRSRAWAQAKRKGVEEAVQKEAGARLGDDGLDLVATEEMAASPPAEHAEGTGEPGTAVEQPAAAGRKKAAAAAGATAAAE